MTLKVMLGAHAVDASSLRAFRDDAFLVGSVRDAITSTTIGFVATFDHATTSSAMSTAKTAALTTLGAIGHRATAATTMKLAESSRLRRVIATVFLTPFATAMADAEASALITQPTASEATTSTTSVALAQSTRADSAIAARN